MTSLLRRFVTSYRFQRRFFGWCYGGNARVLYFGDPEAFVFDPTDWIGREILRTGHWQKDLVEGVAAFLTQRNSVDSGKTLLEVGAHIGTQTVYLSNTGLFDDYILIEPNRGHERDLFSNLKINKIDDCSKVHWLAAGASRTKLRLEVPRINSGAASLSGESDDHGLSAVLVDVDTIDNILASSNVAPKDIGLVWMDVEGFELEAMAGMQTLLELNCPVLFEYTPHLMSEEAREDITETIFDRYDNVLIWEDGFSKLTQSEFAKIQNQVDILCCE